MKKRKQKVKALTLGDDIKSDLLPSSGTPGKVTKTCRVLGKKGASKSPVKVSRNMEKKGASSLARASARICSTTIRKGANAVTVEGTGSPPLRSGDPVQSSTELSRAGARENFVKKARPSEFKPQPQGAKGVFAAKVKRDREARKARRALEPVPPARDLSEAERSKLKGYKPPVISFECSAKERARLVEILDRRPTDPERKALMAKLATEFSRVYTRLRRRVKGQAGYKTRTEEMPLAARVGELCLRAGVTPAHLINYWHAEIGKFTNLTFPPIKFLSSPANVDQAALSAPKAPPGEAKVRVVGHSFDNTDDLDPRLRPALMEAGFDLSEYNDRYLMTVMSAAKARARGTSMFVSSRLLPMVEYAAKHLYGG